MDVLYPLIKVIVMLLLWWIIAVIGLKHIQYLIKPIKVCGMP